MKISSEPNPLQSKTLRDKTAAVHLRLVKAYGRPKVRHENPLESLIWTILSQNTNDNLSERAYRCLRKSFPRWELVLAAPPRKIAEAIRVGGLANQKSRNIKDFLRWLKRTRGRLDLGWLCEIPTDKAVEILGRRRGIGLKTIYVTLLFACGKDVFPVDTHIYRIVRRLGLAPQKFSRDRVTRWMQPLVGKGQAMPLHLNLIRFGREVCHARRPTCYACPLADLCPYPDKTPPPTPR